MHARIDIYIHIYNHLSIYTNDFFLIKKKMYIKHNIIVFTNSEMVYNSAIDLFETLEVIW